MKKITYGVIVFAIIINLNGCAEKSQIQKVSESTSHFDGAVYEGQDFYELNENIKGVKYRIYHQASSGFSGTSGIRRSAETRAIKFCKNKKMLKMLKISEHTAKPPYVLGNFPRIEIIFTCVADKN